MRLNVAVPEPYVTAPVLDAALEGVTRLNEALLRSRQAPLWRDAVKRVRWKPEPPGDEHFDHAGVVTGRGWGDCDDLAPYAAASLRVTGEDRGARAVVKRSGPKRWHAVVRRSDGSIDDPSLEAGMPAPGRRGINGAALPVMFAAPSGVNGGAYIARPQLALRPIPDRDGQPEAWQARVDLPWHWQPGESPGDIAMASLHASPVSDQAIVGALSGAQLVGEASGFAHEDDLDRICCLRDMLEGADWDECADEYGEDHADAAAQVVGGFFGGLKRIAKKAVRTAVSPAGMMRLSTDLAAKGYNRFAPKMVREFVPPSARPMAAAALPIAQQLAPMIPGWGPAAAMALQFASPMLQRSLQQGSYLPPEGPPMQAAPQMPFGFGGGGMPFGFGGGGMPFGFGGGMPFG